MAASSFNGVTYANKLKSAGLDAKVADTIAEETTAWMEKTVVGKTDLANTEATLRKTIWDTEAALKKDLATAEMGIRKDMEILRLQLQKTIIHSQLAVIGILGGLQSVLHFFK